MHPRRGHVSQVSAAGCEAMHGVLHAGMRPIFFQVRSSAGGMLTLSYFLSCLCFFWGFCPPLRRSSPCIRCFYVVSFLHDVHQEERWSCPVRATVRVFPLLGGTAVNAPFPSGLVRTRAGEMPAGGPSTLQELKMRNARG